MIDQIHDVDSIKVHNDGDVPASKSAALPNLKPRRMLSSNDIKGKSGSFLKRSSWSDLTEVSSNDEDTIIDMEFRLEYCEMVLVAGVSDIPEPFDLRDDHLQVQPCAPLGARKIDVAQSKAKAVVSLLSPYKLLNVTRAFCDLFGYMEDSDICGRSLKTLAGPRTDLAAIYNGLQRSAAIERTQQRIALYGRDGQHVDLEATFSPYLSDAETLSGCLLELAAADD